ncbi:MAG: DUF5596 domain-containing protein [Clostridia bacterium]|nr:DUF5596 domain-containing protein [Clostridia bacterium]
MHAYLNDFFELLDYPAQAREVFTLAYRKICASAKAAPRLAALLNRYSENKDLDYPAAIREAGELGEQAGVLPYTTHALLFICLSKRLREYYREQGIDDTIWQNSMLDLKYKAVECYLLHGVWGTFVAQWNKGFFNMTRFALGRLQFEIRPFGFTYEKNGVILTPDSPVLNTHIPRSEAPLSRESVLDAYRQAAAFFRPWLGDAPVAFFCSSWLLFEKHTEMLKPTSNIRRFIGDFDVVEAGNYEDYFETWRLFDKFYTGNPDDMPADSSLRRAYIALMKQGKSTGWGKGVFLY